jgi:hypothetical protein
MLPEIVERHLRAAERHIVTGESCIARQRALIARLECKERQEGLLRAAVILLAQFLKIQAMHLSDRDRSISELNRKTTDRRITQGLFRIAQQRKMISRLESRGEDSQGARDHLALLEGMQAGLLTHRDRFNEMGEPDAKDMGRMQAALLSLLRTSMTNTTA